MPILSLIAKLGLDGRGFRAGMKEAEVVAGKFAGRLKTQLGAAFSVAATTAYIKGVVDHVGRIKDLADQYSITTDEVQKADVALRQNGLQFENLGAVLQKLGQARRDAVEGNTELRDTFERYKITLNDLNSPQVRTYDLLLSIAKAIQGVNLNARDQVELTDLLGNRSLKLLSTLQELQNFDGISLISQEEIERIDKADKLFAGFRRNIKTGAAGIISKFLAIDGRDILSTIFSPAGLKKFFDIDEEAAISTPPLTRHQIEQANFEKAVRLGHVVPVGEESLFDFDKDVKEKKQRQFSRPALGDVDFGVPTPGGFAAGGGVSAGFIAGFDPKVVIAQSQLTELVKANQKLDKLIEKASAADGDGAFRR